MSIARLISSGLVITALAACAPGGGDEGGGAPPSSYELARAIGKENAPVSKRSVIDLSPEQLQAKLQVGKVRLIDVRTDAEVAGGMIAGAEHIPLDRFDPTQLDTSDGREVVLYCRSGRRSAIAARRLADHTGSPVAHLEDGIFAWQEAKLPTSAP